jgi:hypothetical protein
MIDVAAGAPESGSGRWRLVRTRAGPLVGLLFLAGPASDLVNASIAPAREAAIAIAFAGFVALYLALLPPVAPIARGGARAVWAGLALLAAAAGLTLAFGAPDSFWLLFVYVVAAAGVLLPTAAATP